MTNALARFTHITLTALLSLTAGKKPPRRLTIVPPADDPPPTE